VSASHPEQTETFADAYERLSAKRRKFIDLLCEGKTQTDAAREAGYGPRSPKVAAVRLLKHPLVRAAYDQRRVQLAKEAGAEAIRVVQELIRLGFANMIDYLQITHDGAYVDLSKLTREQAAAIQEITVDEYTEGRGENARDVKRTKIKLADKRGALELLGKWLRMWTEKHELTGPDGKPLQPPSLNITFPDGGPGIPLTPEEAARRYKQLMDGNGVETS
jgi:phage terminase small subunit